jgi:hypothetical protein
MFGLTPVKPKGMTNQFKWPYLYLKVVFHKSIYSIGTWWYPNFISILLKSWQLAPIKQNSESRGLDIRS